MALKKVTAIVRNEVLARVKTKLLELGVPHVSIDFVQGLENPQQVFEMPELVTHARLEMLTEDTGVEGIVDCIISTAGVGTYDDGFVAIYPVDRVYKIHNGEPG